MNTPNVSTTSSTNSGSISLGVIAVVIPCLYFLNGNIGTGYQQSGTSTAYSFETMSMTSSGITTQQIQEDSARKINKLKSLSGLTWDKIAEIFDVSRRSVHFWANGMPMEDFRSEKLNYLLQAVEKLNCGYSVDNRNKILSKDSSELSLFELFKKGDFFAAQKWLNNPQETISPQRRELKQLSPKAIAKLQPSVSPIDLINTDNSPTKTNIEKSVRVKIGKRNS